MLLGARRHLREALFFGLRFMVAVRRAPMWRAGFLGDRSTNLRMAATHSFSRDKGSSLDLSELYP